MSEGSSGVSLWSRILALPGLVAALLALAVLGLYHNLLASPIAGWAEMLYPLGASWGYRDWRGLAAIFTPTYWTAFRYGKGDWVPTTFVYFFLERSLAGARPAAINGGALILLTVDSWLVAAAARRLTGKPWTGLFSGLAFCLHPLLWDVSLTMLTSHLMMTFFNLLAFLAYLRAREPGREARRWTALSCLCYLMAMFSKPPGVVFPALILVYELGWAERDTPWRQRLRRGSRALLPYLLPAGLFFALFHWTHPQLQGVTNLGLNPEWTIKDPLLRMVAVVGGLLGYQHGQAVFALLLALGACAALGPVPFLPGLVGDHPFPLPQPRPARRTLPLHVLQGIPAPLRLAGLHRLPLGRRRGALPVARPRRAVPQGRPKPPGPAGPGRPGADRHAPAELAARPVADAHALIALRARPRPAGL